MTWDSDAKEATRRFHTTSSLYLESVRRATFVGWPASHILSPDQLARAGFFYLRTQDHTQCPFCDGIIGYWEPGDVPELEHRRLFPSCPLASGQPTGNVPLVVDDKEEEEDEDDEKENATLETLTQVLQTHSVPWVSSPVRETMRERQKGKLERKMWRLLQRHHVHLLVRTRPRPPKPRGVSLLEWSERVANPGRRVAVPTLNTTESRLQTFTSWVKTEIGVAVEALAQAGFFWTGIGDLVQCFHCHGGILGWRKGEDPFVLHARHYPTCPFVLLERGREFVRQCQEQLSSSSLQHDTLGFDVRLRGVRTHRLTENETRLLLLHPMAQALLTYGLSRESVLETLRLRVEVGGGVLFRNTREAFEEVFNIEETLHKRRTGVVDHGALRPR